LAFPPNNTIVGVTLAMSPKMAEMEKAGNVVITAKYGGDGEQQTLNEIVSGKVNLFLLDIEDALRALVQLGYLERCIIGERNLFHHLSPDRVSNILKQMLSLAYKDNHLRLIVINEPLNDGLKNRGVMRMIAETCCSLGAETAAFDALIGTYSIGGVTPQQLVELVRTTENDVDWKGRAVPNIPPIANQILLPRQQAQLTGGF